MRKTSFLTLMPNKWVNDEIINSYAEIALKNEKYTILNTFVFESFRSLLSTEKSMSGVVYEIRKGKAIEQVGTLNDFFIPININGNQWCLMSTEKGDVYYDSLNRKITSHINETVIKMVQKLTDDKNHTIFFERNLLQCRMILMTVACLRLNPRESLFFTEISRNQRITLKITDTPLHSS